MAGGVLEVTLVEAQGLKNMDFFVKMNTYVIIQYGNQKHTSNVAKGSGTKPIWNEKFTFNVEYPGGADHKYMLWFRIMDTQKLLDHDVVVGESKVYVKDVIALGTERGKAELRSAKHRVVLQDKTYAGEISVALTFTLNS
ncbi:elicitor-responsive protein 1-like [Pyrus x bretschneideri]|uniref:elicitor-responsive protein 1-like n=1 Tax=Pyrus x bretschneideri TaxID=225117 RepID=UPI002030C0A1|nr:elicitor-responsive protein 1-like [Pyrus x bretschneideri]